MSLPRARSQSACWVSGVLTPASACAKLPMWSWLMRTRDRSGSLPLAANWSNSRFHRGYDQSYPDLWRYREWKREFDQFAANGKLPDLSLVRISHDHMGNFAQALAGVNTPETQQADCDLALGKLIEAVAHSRYARDTLVIVIEDDVQDGPDHVDSHRGPA